MVEKLTASLIASDVKAVGIHGDMRTADRRSAMESLKNREVNLLIATDVAARGIDVDVYKYGGSYNTKIVYID